MIRFTVPGRPRGKGRPRFTRAGGKPYTDAKTAAYERSIRELARQAAIKARHDPGNISDAYAVQLDVYYADRKMADLDNVVKAILDGCNGVVWADDRQVVELHAYRHLDHERPRVEAKAWVTKAG